ncbi:hypothetical protein L7F22_057776 [Adiantum nelumboides]|nr:hypothetical protein [Adiantum nelumboides]
MTTESIAKLALELEQHKLNDDPIIEDHEDDDDDETTMMLLTYEADEDEEVDEAGIKPKDIELVTSQAEVSTSKAVTALRNAEGDMKITFHIEHHFFWLRAIEHIERCFSDKRMWQPNNAIRRIRKTLIYNSKCFPAICIIDKYKRKMGCMQSRPPGEDKSAIGSAVFTFTPGLRSPCKTTEVAKVLHAGLLSHSLAENFVALRTRIEAMVSGEGTQPKLLKKKSALGQQQSQSLHYYVADLQLAIEDYLPALLGLIEIEGSSNEALEFSWTNQEDPQQETAIADARYELLSLLHLMAMLGLSQANSLLSPVSSTDGYQPKVTEENKRASLDAFLRASGILKCAFNSVMTEMSEDLKKRLPADLSKDTLHALCMQALGQGIEIQLSFAIDNAKATLAVKRRLACEQLKCWAQVKSSIHTVFLGNIWGEKHKLFVEWKLAEAKATAYYFHGLILDEGADKERHEKAAVCLQLAETLLSESKRFCAEFCATSPATRVPPLMGAMKYLSEKIPKAASTKGRSSGNVDDSVKDHKVPELPDFVVALQPEEYNLPALDGAWQSLASRQ